MSAVFVRPLPFIAAPSATPAVGAVISMADDTAMGWGGTVAPSSYFVIDLGAGTLAYDTIALIGTNLRIADTVQIRTGTTNSGTGNYSGSALPAYSGAKNDTATTKAIYNLGSVRTERYIRIDVSAASHPDGYSFVSRLVVGLAVKTLGIAFNAEIGFNDRSLMTSGPGFSTVDVFDVLTSWKISSDWIPDTTFIAYLAPLLQWAGTSRAFLCIIDDTRTDQQIWSVFGRWTANAAVKIPAFNSNLIEGTIMSVYQ